MTEEMLALALENQQKAGATNVEFLKGTIEAIPLPANTIDVVISVMPAPKPWTCSGPLRGRRAPRVGEWLAGRRDLGDIDDRFGVLLGCSGSGATCRLHPVRAVSFRRRSSCCARG